MRTITRTEKERNRIGFQDFLDGKNEYSYFQKILQGVKKTNRGENIDRNARVKQDHLPFMSYVDTNLYEKLNNRNPLAYEI
mgnify:CR=1 FL=1